MRELAANCVKILRVLEVWPHSPSLQCMANVPVPVQRAALLGRIFPAGIPTLWCPALTHYDRQGAIDRVRITAHLQHLAPHVKGLLIPGSTGDGWELNAQEARQVLENALEQATGLQLHLVIGVLKFDDKTKLQSL